MNDVSKSEVSGREANKIFYEKYAAEYEMLDGRRTPKHGAWVRSRLREISEFLPECHTLLDVASGSGFIARNADGLFKHSFVLDLAYNILKQGGDQGFHAVCGDAAGLPFRGSTIDLAVLFAAVHHFDDFRPVIAEIKRVLKPGGIIYLDHDMNRYFYERYRFFIHIYRRLFRQGKSKKTQAALWHDLSETHAQGIDTPAVKQYLEEMGFEILRYGFHWYGLSGITDQLFGTHKFPQGWAPLGFIIARKQEK